MPAPANAGRGRFIVLDGAEGVGKTTQAKLLTKFLQKHDVAVEEAREPGTTGVGEKIRDLLLHAEGTQIVPAAELLLVMAARAAPRANVGASGFGGGEMGRVGPLRPEQLRLSRRWPGHLAEQIGQLNRFATEGLAPDLYVVLDLPVCEGRQRQGVRASSPDRIESEGLAFLQKVRSVYLELAESKKNAVLIPAGGTVAEVEGRIREEIAPALSRDPRGLIEFKETK